LNIQNEYFFAPDNQERIFVEEECHYEWKILSSFASNNIEINKETSNNKKRKYIIKKDNNNDNEDDNANGRKIKRINGYMLFYHEQMKKNPGAEWKETGTATKHCAELWKKLDEEKKKRYNQKARIIMETNTEKNKKIKDIGKEEIEKNNNNVDDISTKKRGRPPIKTKSNDHIDTKIAENVIK